MFLGIFVQLIFCNMLEAQEVVGRNINYRSYVKEIKTYSQNEIWETALKSDCYFFMGVKNMDGVTRAMVSNETLLSVFHKKYPSTEHSTDTAPDFAKWALAYICGDSLLSIPSDCNAEIHVVDELYSWKQPAYILLRKFINMSDQSVVDYSMLATLYQWNIIIEYIEEDEFRHHLPLDINFHNRDKL